LVRSAPTTTLELLWRLDLGLEEVLNIVTACGERIGLGRDKDRAKKKKKEKRQKNNQVDDYDDGYDDGYRGEAWA